jgi:hypothetical protein
MKTQPKKINPVYLPLASMILQMMIDKGVVKGGCQ